MKILWDKYLGCFEFSKSFFLIFENDVQIFNVFLLNIKNNDLENLNISNFYILKDFHMKN
jgi:hypothetical protein